MSLLEWRPTELSVQALLAARLNGVPLSTTTTPTYVQVAELIDLVQREIALTLDLQPILLDHIDYAKDTVALGTASYVENGLYPEQNPDLSSGAGEYLRRRYFEHLTRLQALLNLPAIA